MKFKILVLFVLFPLFLVAQGEANNWYFGNGAGVTFNTSPPSALTDGQLFTSEGCSVISDASGNLLFYTDGRTVWNRNHQIMSNADYFGGNGLLGDPSSTSSGLIVPHPSNPDLYYVFTVDEPHHDNASSYPNQGPGTANGEYTDVPGSSVPQDDDGYNNGLNFSIVDMSLNGGLGDVIPSQKNMPLITYSSFDSEQIKYKCSEKITAVKSNDCTSIWVITHFIDTYYAFKIDDNGLNTSPVTSEIGGVISTSSYRRSAIGYMKASPNGKKILIAHNTKSFNPSTGNDAENGGVYLADFNDSTGEITNYITLIDNVAAYGVEFSQETKKAYATLKENSFTKIYQWDLESTNIPNSLSPINLLNANEVSNPTALQLAPNGKIYHSDINQSNLNVINNPEADASQINYGISEINGAINLEGKIASFGLPPFIQSTFSSRINIVDDADEITTTLSLCEDESTTLNYDQLPGATYSWRKNGNPLNNSTNTLNVSALNSTNFPITDNYTLTVDLNDGSCPLVGTAEITFHPYPQAVDFTLSQCNIEGEDNSSFFNLTNANNAITEPGENIEITYYTSLQQAEQNGDEIDNPESYESQANPEIIIVKILNTESMCTSYAELTLEVSETSLPIQNLKVCATDNNNYATFNLNEVTAQLKELNINFEVSFYLNEVDSFLEENTINNIADFKNTIPTEQTIYARVENNGSCEGIVPVNLEVLPLVPIGEDKSITYCLENLPRPIELSSGIPENELQEYTYLWEPSEATTATIETTEITTHSVTATNKTTGCSATRTIEITPSNNADFNVITEDFKTNNTLRITLSEESKGDYEYSLDNQFSDYQDTPFFQQVTPGIHRVYVRDKNGCGITTKEFVILGVRKFFTPNNDGINDYWNILGKDFKNISSVNVTIFNRFGKFIASFNGNNRGWDGTYNGKPLPSNDYWYAITPENGRVIKGNFTLKR